MLQIQQNQIRKVDEGIVVDPSFPVSSSQACQIQPCLHVAPLLRQIGLLGGRYRQLQLLDIVQRIADLMLDGQGDENVRMQIGISVGMQVCGELHLFPDIGLYQGFPERIFVVLGLAHEGLGNGRNQGIDFNFAVRVDVGKLGAVQPENVDPLTVALDIAGDPSRDDGSAVLHHCLLAGDGCQIVDQIVRLMVDGLNGVGQDCPVHTQSHHNVLFLVQIQLSKVTHIITLRFACFLQPLYHRYEKMTEVNRLCHHFYPVASSMFSIKIP